MEKVVWVLWRDADAEGALGPWLLDALADVAGDTRGVTACIEDPSGSWMRRGELPGGALLGATVSVWLDSIDEREPVAAALAGAPAAAVHAYLVAESVPKARPMTWGAGEQSPGAAISTVFDKRPDIDDDRFFALWHGEHTPLTFEIHPFDGYVRNTVVRALTPGAPPLRAIVDESVADAEDLYDLHRFFGSGGDKQRLRDQMARVDAHVGSFSADLQTTPTAEWIIRPTSWR